MSLIESILSPGFLVNNLEIIALVVSVMILVLFDEFVMTKIIFPSADFVKYWLAQLFSLFYEKKGIKSKWAIYLKKYSSEALATVLVIVYCYIGCDLFSDFVILPIFLRWQSFITIVVLVMFLVANHIINDARKRRRIFGVGIYNPEKKK